MLIADQTNAAGIVPNHPTPTFGNPDGPHDQVVEGRFPLPEWPAETIAVLSTIDREPYAIPVTAPLRVTDRRILFSLKRTRASLARLCANPQVALTILAKGDVAFTARGRAEIAEDAIVSTPEFAAVALDVTNIDDHRAPGLAVESGVSLDWTNNSTHQFLQQHLDALRVIAGSERLRLQKEKPMSIANQTSTVRSVPNRPTPTFGNPDLPPQGRLNTAGNPESLRSDGPRNKVIESQFPSQMDPPATDISTQPFFWSSFNISPKRIQNGGWARELTSEDFAISDEIAGVNMHLAPGGIRELHWHQTAEWAVMTRGRCRITTIDFQGRPSVDDVEEGDLWYFPAGLPHSLQGLGPLGAEFILAFDDGKQSESNTLLVTDWIAHTPPDVLAKNFGVPKEVFGNIPLNNLWIFQGEEPGDLAADRAAAGVQPGAEPVVFRLSRSKPVKESSGGRVQIADSTNFKISKTIASALVTVEPGGMREMHWHPNADEWQYYLRGQARMTVFNTGPKATTNDFRAGDVGVVRKSLGHYVENTGSDVLQFLEVFRASRYEEVSLAEWFSHLPPELVMQHLNLTREDLAKFPRGRRAIVPL